MTAYWSQAPLARLILPFLTGILAGIHINIPIAYILALIVCCFVIITSLSLLRHYRFQYKYGWWTGIYINIFLLLAGYQLVILNTDKFDSAHFQGQLADEEQTILLTLDEPLVEKKRSLRTVARVNAIIKQGQWFPTNGRMLVYFKKGDSLATYHYGDRLLIKGRIQPVPPPGNPEEFNYKRYLSYHNIYHQVFVGKDRHASTGQHFGNTIKSLSLSIRNKLQSTLRSNNLKGEELAVASALILGDKSELDKDLSSAYASAGAMHVLAVSGLHVGIIFLVLNSILLFLEKIKYGPFIKAVILILCLWFYAFVTGLSPSVTRAATMFSFVIIGQTFNRHTNIYNTLAASAFLLLIVNPYLIMEVGFQLSYLAVIGIVLIQPPLYNLWEPNNRLLDSIWAITTVSIAAQITTFPLGLLYFHQFPSYFLFSNLIVIPCATVILYGGVLLFALSFFAIISGTIGWILSFVIYFLNASVRFIDELPYSIVSGLSITIWETWIIYVIILLVILFFLHDQVKYLAAAFLATALLLTFQLGEGYMAGNRSGLVVYNIGNTSAYDLISGKDHLFISDSSFLSDTERKRFHIEHYWWKQDLNSPELINIHEQRNIIFPGVYYRNSFAQLGNKRVAITGSNLNFTSKKPIIVDYVIVNSSCKSSVIELDKFFKSGIYIIDSSVNYYREKQLIAELKKLDRKYHSVRELGAFVGWM